MKAAVHALRVATTIPATPVDLGVMIEGFPHRLRGGFAADNMRCMIVYAESRRLLQPFKKLVCEHAACRKGICFFKLDDFVAAADSVS
ncbi:MAG: hypothetical protein Aurels2KO_39300 [Aureliella sp.]